MKKIATLFAALLMVWNMSASTTFTFSSADAQTKDGITLTIDKGAGTSAPKYHNVYNTDTYEMRLYANNTITVSGSNITNIQITFSKQGSKDYADLSADCGTLTSGGKSTSNDDQKVDTWTGNASQVVFTIGPSGQRIIYSVVVTTGGEAPEPGGDDPIVPDNPSQPQGGEQINGLAYADGYYYEVGDGIYAWDFDLYKDYDYDAYAYVYPEVYLQVLANSETAINGTYQLYYAGYWKSAKDSVETDYDNPIGTVTIKNMDNEGMYSFQGSFQGTDSKTYTFNSQVDVWVMNYDTGLEITLNETVSNPDTPDTPDTPTTPDTPAGVLTCAQAASIAAASGYKGTENVTVMGYVTELGKDKVDSKTQRTKQCFHMADTANGGKQFYAFWAFVPQLFEVGDIVKVTGKLQNYQGTIEIADGEAEKVAATGLEEMKMATSPVKTIINGQLVIYHNGKVYNAQGSVLK